jgi:hypothetical protein
MVVTSIAAANGDLGGFARLIAEGTAPRCVEAMRGKLGLLQKNLPSVERNLHRHHDSGGSATMKPWSIDQDGLHDTRHGPLGWVDRDRRHRRSDA